MTLKAAGQVRVRTREDAPESTFHIIGLLKKLIDDQKLPVNPLKSKNIILRPSVSSLQETLQEKSSAPIFLSPICPKPINADNDENAENDEIKKLSGA